MNNTFKISALLIVSLVIMWSCEQTSKSNKLSKEEISEGLALLESTCISCHSPEGSMDSRVAPPLIAIKKHYISSNTTLEEFTKEFVAYMNDPNKESSKMPGAVAKFGVMPKLSMSEESLIKIANYIYYTKLDAPEWFQKHYEKQHGKPSKTDSTISPAEKAQQLAMQTKAVLGKNLLGAINSRGTVGALEFCNTKAILLTDSMSKALQARIYRLSDNPRNPSNLAQEPFLSKISEYKNLMAQGKEPKGGNLEHKGNTYYYYPIVTNAMCLQCHGQKGKHIQTATLTKIKELYPKDMAIGYSENELRGIWVVEME